MFAIVKIAGHQYLVTEGQQLNVPTLDVAAGKTTSFSDVLMVADKDQQIGTPLVKGAKIEATVVSHGRAAKVTGVKFHNKVRYRRTFGHRQPWTKIKIDKIVK